MRGCGPLAAPRASVLALIAGLLWTPGVAISATKHTAPSAKLPFAYDTSGVVAIGANPASVSGPAVLQFQGVNNATFDPRATQPISLGQFAVAPSTLVSGQATTYSGTPFEVEIKAPEFNKVNTVPVLDKLFPTFGKRLDLKTVVENSLLLKGHLDGTIGANGQANVVATVDSIKLGSLEAPTQNSVTHYAFPIRFSQLKLPTSWVMSATGPSVTTSLPTTTTTTPTTATTTTTPTTATATGSATTMTPSNGIAPTPAAEMLVATTSRSVGTPTPTPEPSTVVFFAVALGGLVLGRRRLKTS